MGPKCYERDTESLHCNLGGIDRSSRLDRNVTKGNREFATHLGETEIPIGEIKVTRVCGNGYVKRTRWRRIEGFGGAEFDFWFGTYVDVRKWLRALEHICTQTQQGKK